MPFASPKLHPGSGIQEANEDKEGNANGCHCDTEVLEVVFGGHICHAEDRSHES